MCLYLFFYRMCPRWFRQKSQACFNCLCYLFRCCYNWICGNYNSVDDYMDLKVHCEKINEALIRKSFRENHSNSLLRVVNTACLVIQKIECNHSDLLCNLTLNIYHKTKFYQFTSGTGGHTVIINYTNKHISCNSVNCPSEVKSFLKQIDTDAL